MISKRVNKKKQQKENNIVEQVQVWVTQSTIVSAQYLLCCLKSDGDRLFLLATEQSSYQNNLEFDVGLFLLRLFLYVVR